MKDLIVSPRISGENNQEYAFRILNDNIIKMHLKPNTVVNEAELTRLLNVSRTPIREAILHLKSLGLVQVYPQKASVVTRINLGLLREGYFLRSEIEPLVYQIACKSVSGEAVAELSKNLLAQKAILDSGDYDFDDFFALDSAFHHIIYVATQRANVWKAIQSISGHFQRVRYFDAMHSAKAISDFYEDHKTIYYSIISGSLKPIRELYPDHLSFYQKSLPLLLEQHPDYFDT